MHIRQELDRLIKLGLWEQAMIRASKECPSLKIKCNDFDELIISWYDYNTHFQCYMFDQFSWKMWILNRMKMRM